MIVIVIVHGNARDEKIPLVACNIGLVGRKPRAKDTIKPRAARARHHWTSMDTPPWNNRSKYKNDAKDSYNLMDNGSASHRTEVTEGKAASKTGVAAQ